MRKYIPWLIVVATLIWGVHKCERAGFYKSSGESNAAALTDTVKHFTNRLGTQTASIRTLQLDKKGMQEIIFKKDKELASLAKEFSKVKYVAKFASTAQFDSIGIKFDVPIDLCATDTVGRFERTGSLNRKWFALDYRVTNDSLQIPKFTTWTETTVITGTKRSWFLGKETLRTDITNSNPHITVTGITSAELTLVSPWYRKWYVWLAAGLAGGLLIK